MSAALAPAPDGRPDPDALLAQLRESQGARGRLRIYFGASAGVGKTYAMLGAAQRELKAGREVLAGVLETHGRGETAELLAGLPQLPLRQVPYRGSVIAEFDLDGALARKPRVLLVDELAHTNAEGSRHPKRWQDVEELLAAGIEVWSTLNVQHLESLNGTVGSITGIRVHETVPDRVLDNADEVVLVDVTPDELIARLKAGKVYLPQQAEHAAKNFFRKGNLIALREIALRRTAEHVEDDVRSYRVEQSIGKVWNTEGALLACVGPREGGEHVVRACARLAGQLGVRWHAAYVETPRLQRLAREERDRILAVLKLAGELGAQTTVLTGEDIAGALVAHAQTQNCATLVMGRSAAHPLAHFWTGGAQRLARLAPGLNLLEVGEAGSSRRLGSGTREQAQGTEPGGSPWTGYAWAAAAGVLITLLAAPLHSRFALANIVMLFLLGVVLVGLRFGRGPAALAAFLNVAAFDYFFVEPRFSFAVSDVQYVFMFAVMLAVGLLTGQLTAGLRFSARIAAAREKRAQSLFDLTRELSGALMATQVAELGAQAVQRDFGGHALVLVADANDALQAPENAPAGFDIAVADWALRNGQPAGLSTGTLPAQPWHYVPLKAPMRARGVLALQPAQARALLIPEQVQQLGTLARQIAIALERVHYVDIARQATVQMESERLRNAVLGAISHDVRTPLTALIGLADALRQSQPLDEDQRDMAGALAAQARELSALVNNLLEMARLQSGTVRLRMQWQSVEEVVGAAIRAARPALGTREVKTSLPADLPLVEFDAVLIERVLFNLLENAAKYGAPPVEISARAREKELVLRVRDHGPGLPASMRGRERELFDKFTRGEAETSVHGAGLGLAIVKAIVDAHGGRIEAADADGGGAVFTLTLPRGTPPAIEEPASA